ncbi:MAG: putative GTP-binding protein EngB [Candidatus Mesenet longicola]|uniref:Probable GTP-binding protein EngB n=1 Tax=Candidatus Mesenet longicola TaxID=1892558 RepID=A0A8J3HPX1_9RICK|nr:MAG: putative GTP-binding protein EngB [Candidatus Mesenet longicola]GHM59676.1 MAG: putative GTP-binding protein EngB [Candidatus Mesenet longicola]
MIRKNSFVFGISDIKSFLNNSDLSTTVPEVAFAGRSNVGKSSLINKLIHNKAARVSSKPGCTRQINFYTMNNGKIRIVDLPGYGYSAASKQDIAQYLKLIEYYLINRSNLQRVFLLIDARRGLKEIDEDFVFWLIQNQISFQLILTKIDEINLDSLTLSLENIKKWMSSKGLLTYPTIAFSVYQKSGIKELRNEIAELSRK